MRKLHTLLIGALGLLGGGAVVALAATRPAASDPRRAELSDARTRAAIEDLSGYSLADVRIHHGSAYPAVFGALAFTVGPDVYLGIDNDFVLAHELWHVVQQQAPHRDGAGVLDDPQLEAEADLAAHLITTDPPAAHPRRSLAPLDWRAHARAVQLFKISIDGGPWVRHTDLHYSDILNLQNDIGGSPLIRRISVRAESLIELEALRARGMDYVDEVLTARAGVLKGPMTAEELAFQTNAVVLRWNAVMLAGFGDRRARAGVAVTAVVDRALAALGSSSDAVAARAADGLIVADMVDETLQYTDWSSLSTERRASLTRSVTDEIARQKKMITMLFTTPDRMDHAPENTPGLPARRTPIAAADTSPRAVVAELVDLQGIVIDDDLWFERIAQVVEAKKFENPPATVGKITDLYHTTFKNNQGGLKGASVWGTLDLKAPRPLTLFAIATHSKAGKGGANYELINGVSGLPGKWTLK